MTREQYMKHLRPDEYVGKHEKKAYNIWRVTGPSGPQERFSVTGIEKAAECVSGCWDWEVTDMNNNKVPGYILSYFFERRKNVENNKR